MRSNNPAKRRRKDLNGLLFPEMAENHWRGSSRRTFHDCRDADVDASLTAPELRAGAGGEALGLEQAGGGMGASLKWTGMLGPPCSSDRSNWDVERLGFRRARKGLASSLGYET